MTHPWRRPASREEIEAQRREARERREALDMLSERCLLGPAASAKVRALLTEHDE